MTPIVLALLIVAVVLWVLAALGWPAAGRVSLGWLGCAFAGLAALVAVWPGA